MDAASELFEVAHRMRQIANAVADPEVKSSIRRRAHENEMDAFRLKRGDDAQLPRVVVPGPKLRLVQ